MKKSEGENPERGAALVEALVAFTILVAAVITAFQIFGDGLGRISAARTRLALSAAAREVVVREVEPQVGGRIVIASDGQRFFLETAIIDEELAPWSRSRPLRVRLWAGEEANGQPMFETVLMGGQEP